MKRLAWHKLGLLLVCGLIATGCEPNDNSGAGNINWESVNLENLPSSDELLDIVNDLKLFPDRITAIDDSCLDQISNINDFLATNRTITCEVQFENEEEPVTIDFPITFNPPGQNNDNPDSRNPITDPVDDDPDPILDNPDSGGGVIITDPPIPDPPITVSESQSIAGLGFFSILLVGKRTFNRLHRKSQVKKKSSFHDK
jgi:hypothetical protein